MQESATESKKSLAKKQMRYMTTQYRKQIRFINQELNTNVPSQISAQERIAQRHKNLKNEILKRPQKGQRYNSQSINFALKSSVQLPKGMMASSSRLLGVMSPRSGSMLSSADLKQREMRKSQELIFNPNSSSNVLQGLQNCIN